MRKPNVATPEFFLSMLHHLEVRLKDRDPAAVIDHFERYRHDLESAPNATAAMILRLVARAQASLANYKVALVTIRTAQAKAAKVSDRLIVAEICMTLADLLRDMNEFKEAARAYQDAESIFRRYDSDDGQARAVNQLAGIYFRQNQYSRSLELLLEAADIANRINDTKSLSFVMGNIGRVYTFLGQLAQAEKHIRINIDLARELNDPVDQAKALLSLGYVMIQRADFTEAERALDDAYQLIVVSEDRRSEVIYLTYLGELQYRQSLTDDAARTLQKGLTLAEQVSPNSTLAGRVMRHLAETYVRTKNWRLASKYLCGARVIYNKVDDQVELGALGKLQAVVEAANQPGSGARKLFRESINQLEATGVIFELLDGLLAAASCGAFSQREQMGYLFRSEQICHRLKLTGQLDRIETIISTFDQPLSKPRSNRKTYPDHKSDFITVSPEVIKIKEQMSALAKADLPLLLMGETGVGKDQMARYFHSVARPDGPYIPVNCASVPATLLESELFGHKKGAFTGADSDRIGRFVSANGGILFLDEIGEMDVSLQAKLLGVLERRKVLPLGSTKEVDLDIKLVAATNCNLEAMVESGQFRRDLYYRLSGISFVIPPLRDRKEDIPVLLERFMAEHGMVATDHPPQLDQQLVRLFVAYDWPGNVRELLNKVKRLEAMKLMATENDLAELVRLLFSDSHQTLPVDTSLFDRVEQFERKLITEALIAARGNKSQTARMLGVHEATVRTKLKRYGIEQLVTFRRT